MINKGGGFPFCGKLPPFSASVKGDITSGTMVYYGVMIVSFVSRNVLFAGELRAYDRVSCMIDQPLVGIISVYKLFFVAFIFKDS